MERDDDITEFLNALERDLAPVRWERSLIALLDSLDQPPPERRAAVQRGPISERLQMQAQSGVSPLVHLGGFLVTGGIGRP